MSIPNDRIVVGDRWLDVALARAVGAKGILVRTGYGAAEETRPPHGLHADAIADNLIGAASWVLGEMQKEEGKRPKC